MFSKKILTYGKKEIISIPLLEDMGVYIMIKKTGIIFLTFLLTLSVMAQDNKVKQKAFAIVKSGNLTALKELVQSQKLSLVQILNSKKRTLLHEASYAGQLEIVQYLVVNAKLDVNQKDGLGWTPLMDSIVQGKSDVFNYLSSLKNKIDLEVKNEKGETALFIAAQNKKIEYIKTLIEKGADIKVTDIEGWSLLEVAVQKKDLDMAELFFNAGVKVNHQNGRGRTTLHEAAQQGNLKLTEWLIGKGADVNVLDYTVSQSLRPLDVATDPQVIQMLKKAGAKYGISLFEDSLQVGIGGQYSSVVDVDIIYGGLQLEYFLSHKASLSWDFMIGQGEQDYNYYRFPGTLLALHTIFTGFTSSYDKMMGDKSTLLKLLFAGSAILPQGINIYIVQDKDMEWLSLVPYFNWAAIDLGQKSNDDDVYVGGELGVRINMFFFRRLKVAPFASIKLMYNTGHFGYTAGLNIGYLF